VGARLREEQFNIQLLKVRTGGNYGGKEEGVEEQGEEEGSGQEEEQEEVVTEPRDSRGSFTLGT
jgi:hypothetical protein